MLHRHRDPDSCDIQIRLPEVSKRQAKIELVGEEKVRERHRQSAHPGALCQHRLRAAAGLDREYE